MRFLILPLLCSLILLVNCAKLPEKFISPHLTVSAEFHDNKIFYTITLRAGLSNENSDVVLKDCKGDCILKDSDTILSFPFDVPAIFPFDTFVVTIIKKGDAEEMNSLFDVFHIDRDKLDKDGIKDGIVEELNVQHENIELKRISCDSISIFKVLGKEKNKGDKANEADR